MESLKKWNFLAAALHLGAAITVYIILKNKRKRQVQTIRLAFDKNVTQESRVDIPVKLENSQLIDLKPFLIGFFAITAGAHFVYATDFFGKGWYSKEILGYGWNPFRWIEYSLSASLMIYIISLTSGTKEQVSAIAAALITPGLMINGFTTERELHQNAISTWSLNPSTKKPFIDSTIIWSNLVPAWFLFGVHWYIILSNYSKILKEAKKEGKPIDGSVQFMVFSQLGFFALFGVIQTYQAGRWFTCRSGRIEPSFIVYEKSYIILSAITKLALAATVAYALRN